MKRSKLDSQCYKIKNFFTKNPHLVHVPYYNWSIHDRINFRIEVIDAYYKLGGK